MPQNDNFVFISSIYTGLTILGGFYLIFYFELFPNIFIKDLFIYKLNEACSFRILIYKIYWDILSVNNFLD